MNINLLPNAHLNTVILNYFNINNIWLIIKIKIKEIKKVLIFNMKKNLS